MADNSKVLSKLVIHSFEKNDFREESQSFTTPINPETFTKTNHVELDMARGHGQPGTDPKYKSTAPEELKIEFILDGTKTMEGYVKKYFDMEVSEQLKEFTDCVYQYKGNIHRPRFLIVRWGSEIKFPCVLSNMDISYSLFKPNGDPLRVKVTATFVKYDTPEAIFRANNINSPDLTHIKTFTQGSRLDLMTFKVYNDVNFFLQVARFNQLSSVRKIKTGTDLYFPPLNKNEA